MASDPLLIQRGPDPSLGAERLAEDVRGVTILLGLEGVGHHLVPCVTTVFQVPNREFRCTVHFGLFAPEQRIRSERFIS